LPAGGLLLFVAAATLLTAILAPPTTWDSMTYHMSRVAHWQAQRAVSPYPTHIQRQLHMAPWAEFAILQLQVLSNGDRFANLVQWLAMIGCALGASLISRRLGAPPTGQFLASALVLAIPEGTLQASSTQNDYAAALWLVCFVATGLHIRAEHRSHLDRWIFLGSALGLALLTKATSYVYILPFFIWFFGSSILRFRLRNSYLLLLVILVAVVINSGYYTRNMSLYSSPLGPTHEGRADYLNGLISPEAVASNILRNLYLQTETPFHPINTAIYRLVLDFHGVFGLAPSDPRTTWLNTQFAPIRLSFHEGSASTPIQMIIITIALFLTVFAAWKGTIHNLWLPYATSIIAGFALFCLLLRWQPWNTRLHLPIIVLAMPFTAAVISRFISGKRVIVLTGIMLATVLPWTLHNASRQIIGRNSILFASRDELYFVERPSLRGPYRATADTLARMNCLDVGLISGSDSWEYPLWVLLREKMGNSVRMVGIDVHNESASIAPYDPRPCAVLQIDDRNEIADVRTSLSFYVLAEQNGPISIWLRQR
jgi:hypothetical protein